MNQLKRRMKYQYGTLTLETRTRGPCVWTYRYFDWVDGRKRRRKAIVGTVEQYRTRAMAERACEPIRLAANTELLSPHSPTMGALVDRYAEQVLRPCIDIFLWGARRTVPLGCPFTAPSPTTLCSPSGYVHDGSATG